MPISVSRCQSNYCGVMIIDQIKFKTLAILHSWLEQPYAHADLMTPSFENHLKKFLKSVLGENNDFLSNIAKSIKVLSLLNK